MKVSIIAKCDRCQKQFVIESKAGDPVLPLLSKDKVHFKPEDKLKRLSYVKSIEVGEYDNVNTVSSGTSVFCEECDREYWRNFDDAVKVLEGCWHDVADID